MAPTIFHWIALSFGLVLLLSGVETLEVVTIPAVPSGGPTVFGDKDFNATADAEYLVSLLGDTEDYVNEALAMFTQRTAKQRENIYFEINRLFGNPTLFASLLPFTSDEFGVAMSAVLSTASILYASELHEAVIAGEEDTLLEILLCLGKIDRNETFEEYEAHFGTTFLADFNALNSSEIFKDIIDILSNEARNDIPHVDQGKAKSTARILMALLEIGGSIDFTILNYILLITNGAQVQEIDREYSNLTGHTIRAAVNRKFFGSTRDLYDAIVRYTVNPHRYLAERLHEAIFDYEEPDLATINRIIIGRAEIDLADIATYYRHRYSRFLSHDLETVTTDQHLDLLLMFLNDYPWAIAYEPQQLKQ